MHKCHFEDCMEMAEFVCRYNTGCAEHGCGKKMCRKHRSKYGCYTKKKRAKNPDVCLNCEPEAIKASKKAAIIPLAICCPIFLCMVIGVIVIAATEGGTKM